MLPCASPAVEKKKEEKCQLFHYIPSAHSVDQKNPPKPQSGRVSLCLYAKFSLFLSVMLIYHANPAVYILMAAHIPAVTARWQIFPLLLFARRMEHWGLDSLLQLPGQSQTSMKRGADRARFAPLCCVQARKQGRSGRKWIQDLGQSLK